MKIRLQGVRGTVPVHGPDFTVFGGATSCVLVQAGAQSFILDAGTGLTGADFRSFCGTEHFTMLISHGHVDHLMGFPIFSPLFDDRMRGDIYLRTREGRGAREQIERLMSPPLWPVPTAAARARLTFHDVPEALAVGNVEVAGMEACHPGGSTIYRLRHEGRTLVYATDHESDAVDPDAFAAFAHGADLLLLDAQYTDADYARTRGFGHATISHSARLAALTGAKQTLFIHHDPTRTDGELLALEKLVQAEHPAIRFGRVGEEVIL